MAIGRGSMTKEMFGNRVRSDKPMKKMNKGGMAKCYASGGKVTRGDGCAMRGKTKGRMV
jgi:hypothetical protein